jgi:beta-phosphoglucomutase family hydrolase
VSSDLATAVAVLFDLDGVIVDSRQYHVAAWERWARDERIEHHADYFTRMFGLRNDAIIGGLRPALEPAELKALAERKEALFRELARGNLTPLPGVLAILDALEAAGVPKAVVTSTPRANLDMVLETLGIAGRFQALVAEEDAAKGKPDPEGFLVAASRLGVDPTRCVVIEDAPAGLQGAKAGGMRALGITTTHQAEALEEADLVVDSLDDPAVLDFILH